MGAGCAFHSGVFSNIGQYLYDINGTRVVITFLHAIPCAARGPHPHKLPPFSLISFFSHIFFRAPVVPVVRWVPLRSLRARVIIVLGRIVWERDW